MTLAALLRPEAPAGVPEGVALVDAAEGLEAILRPDCAAAIWARPAPPGFSAWIDALDPARLPRARGTLAPARAGRVAARLANRSGMPEGPHRDWFAADVGRLAERFARLTGAGRLRLRLDVVTGNACRRFHVDRLTARLICTYRGAGTEIGTSPDPEGRAEPARICALPPAAPIVLRGTLWPESPSSRLLHRSPPIEGTGETRLVLVLDPVGPDGDDDAAP